MLAFKNKKNQIYFLIISIVLYVVASYVWMNCVKLACSESLIDNYLATLKMVSLVFTILAFGFLILPTRYFNAWLKYIFSWAFPLSILLVVTTRGTGDWLVISKTDVVHLLGMVFGVVTLVFILVQRFYFKVR